MGIPALVPPAQTSSPVQFTSRDSFWMRPRTISIPRSKTSAPFGIHILHVIFVRPQEEAFKSIHARGSITFVQDLHTFRNRPNENFPSKAVGSHKSPAVPKLTVTIGVSGTAPKPTFFGLLNPRPKPLDERKEWMSYTTPPLLKFNFLTRLANRIKEIFAMAEVKITRWFDNLTVCASFQGSTSRRWPEGWCAATRSGAGLLGLQTLAAQHIITSGRASSKFLHRLYLESMGVVA